ncbi:MAG: GNAT family N-acetyltransferase [Spirochaetales bacterium]|nr:GNAT family N-acetyltransferase [Spirochaetales bacterium]
MIETGRLFIRQFRQSDWEDLYRYLSLPEIFEFEPGSPVTKDEAKKLAAERAAGNDFFAVILREINKMVGHLYFHHTDPKEYMTWELGFIFNPTYHNNGYCTEASKAIIDFAFTVLKAHRVAAYCNPANIPSWKVLEKIGMKREGCFRQKAFFRRDKNDIPIWHDCYAYGIVENE